jgi:hypothetical protein
MRSTVNREVSRFRSWVPQPGFKLSPIHLTDRTAEHDSLTSGSNLEEVTDVVMTASSNAGDAGDACICESDE